MKVQYPDVERLLQEVKNGIFSSPSFEKLHTVVFLMGVRRNIRRPLKFLCGISVIKLHLVNFQPPEGCSRRT